MFKIIENKKLNDSVFLMEIEAPEVARKVKAGQFVILRTDEKGERVPFTVAMSDAQKGTVTLVVQTVGYTTKKLSTFAPGSEISDLVGPLGVPTDFHGAKKACVIGGGVGCAIAFPSAKALKATGAHVDVIAGFRNKELVILEEEFSAVADNLYVTTDDGSHGEKGFVTDKLRALAEGGAGYDLVIAIGPVPMMKFVSKLTKELGIKTIVSLNPIMIDGTGMCGCCRVTVDGKLKFACVDGPDFDGHLVDYDELMLRNGTYSEREKEKDHVCNIGLGE